MWCFLWCLMREYMEQTIILMEISVKRRLRPSCMDYDNALQEIQQVTNSYDYYEYLTEYGSQINEENRKEKVKRNTRS